MLNNKQTDIMNEPLTQLGDEDYDRESCYNHNGKEYEEFQKFFKNFSKTVQNQVLNIEQFKDLKNALKAAKREFNSKLDITRFLIDFYLEKLSPSFHEKAIRQMMWKVTEILCSEEYSNFITFSSKVSIQQLKFKDNTFIKFNIDEDSLIYLLEEKNSTHKEIVAPVIEHTFNGGYSYPYGYKTVYSEHINFEIKDIMENTKKNMYDAMDVLLYVILKNSSDFLEIGYSEEQIYELIYNATDERVSIEDLNCYEEKCKVAIKSEKKFIEDIKKLYPDLSLDKREIRILDKTFKKESMLDWLSCLINSEDEEQTTSEYVDSTYSNILVFVPINEVGYDLIYSDNSGILSKLEWSDEIIIVSD